MNPQLNKSTGTNKGKHKHLIFTGTDYQAERKVWE